MAAHYVTQLIDDLTGDVIPAGNGRTVPFALNGHAYEIDLTHAEANRLEKALGKYVASARRVKRKEARPTRRSG